MPEKPSWEQAFPEYVAMSELITAMTVEGMLSMQQTETLEKKFEDARKEKGIEDNQDTSSFTDRQRMREVAMEVKETLLRMFSDPENKIWINHQYDYFLKGVNPSAKSGWDLN